MHICGCCFDSGIMGRSWREKRRPLITVVVVAAFGSVQSSFCCQHSFVAAAAAVAPLNNNANVTAGDDDPLAFLSAYSQWKFDMYPEYASSVGFRHERHDDKLSDASPAGYKKMLEGCSDFADRASKMVTTNGPHRRYVELLLQETGACMRGMAYRGFAFAPVNYREGAQFSLPQLFSKAKNFQLDGVEDYRRVLDRLEAVPDHLHGVMESLTVGMEDGLTYSNESLFRAQEQFDRIQVADITQSDFYTFFRSLKGKDGSAMQEEAKQIISKWILPSFRRLDDFLKKEYAKKLRPGPGILEIPNGKAFYVACLRFHTSLSSVTPEEIHNMGLEGVATLTQELKDVQQNLGYGNTTLSTFFRALQGREDQKFETKEAALEFYRHTLQEKIIPKLERVVELDASIRDRVLSLKVSPTPPGDGGVAYYSGPSSPDFEDGTFYLNLDRTDSFRKFETVALVLHEGLPGHHYQAAVLRNDKDIPDFLRYDFYDSLSPVPSRPPIYTAHSEGWGLYAEHLGREMGAYEDSTQLAGYYSWRILRYVRLVVDTGVHYFGWSRDRAIKYMLQNTGVSRPSAEMGIDRYITWPGQATAYAVGESKIREARAAIDNELGGDFDLKSFHRSVILCPGGMEQLLECVREREKKRVRLQHGDPAAGSARTAMAPSVFSMLATVLVGALLL